MMLTFANTSMMVYAHLAVDKEAEYGSCIKLRTHLQDIEPSALHLSQRYRYPSYIQSSLPLCETTVFILRQTTQPPYAYMYAYDYERVHQRRLWARDTQCTNRPRLLRAFVYVLLSARFCVCANVGAFLTSAPLSGHRPT